MTGYSIQDLAGQFNVTHRALRFYESKGLLAPAKRGQTRIFSERDKTRLMLTLRGKKLGFSLEECRDIIDMYDPSQSDDTRQLLRLCQKITQHRSALLEKMNAMEATLKLMDEVEQKCLDKLLENAD
ncbi:MAG: MerR family DNA-binding transcriptional regulator [Gammaproteobacteria bacterium]|nr:MerR family DNA-binding transcriptional regulator [Gammaproteobacteria bacterium]